MTAITPVERAGALGDPRDLFDRQLTSGEAALLVDDAGLVMAGRYPTPDGRDAGDDLSAALSGVSDEASRAARHLGFGEWQSIVFESDAAIVALAPVTVRDTDDRAVLLVATTCDTPLGALRRTVARCLALASSWLASGRTA